MLIYACIYGFTQLDGQWFSGSLQYLADWTNSTRQGVVKCLKSLVEKGYLEKADKVVSGVKFCDYRTTKFNGAYNKVAQGMQQSCTGGVQQSLPHNIDIDNLKKKHRYISGTPTLEEVKAYCAERNNGVDAEKWFDFYSAKGWKIGKDKMVDWKAAVRTWERRENNGGSKRTDFVPYPDEW